MVGMYDLTKVFLLCVKEMKEAGIPVQEGRVAEREAGHIEGCLWLCNDPNCYGFAIVVREGLLHGGCPIRELKEAVIQGLFHACHRCQGHGGKWVKYARMMGDAYGYSLLGGRDGSPAPYKGKPAPQRHVCRDCWGIFASMEKGNHSYRCAVIHGWQRLPVWEGCYGKKPVD